MQAAGVPPPLPPARPSIASTLSALSATRRCVLCVPCLLTRPCSYRSAPVATSRRWPVACKSHRGCRTIDAARCSISRRQDFARVIQESRQVITQYDVDGNGALSKVCVSTTPLQQLHQAAPPSSALNHHEPSYTADGGAAQ
jgi:hypothetical protein